MVLSWRKGRPVWCWKAMKAAKARGAKILGVLAGCGEHADDFHRTRTSPDGMPMIKTIKKALADAGLSPEDIGYVNAHGTSTRRKMTRWNISP